MADGFKRYLTPESKARELEYWEAAKREQFPPPHLAANPGGYGFPDPAIFVACDRLNALEGVCTLQSCAGHWSNNSIGESTNGERHPVSGQLWLSLSPGIARQFYERMFLLAGNPLIEGVRILAQGYGQEVADIQFQGEAHGKLQESVEVIVDFFRVCSQLDAFKRAMRASRRGAA